MASAGCISWCARRAIPAKRARAVPPRADRWLASRDWAGRAGELGIGEAMAAAVEQQQDYGYTSKVADQTDILIAGLVLAAAARPGGARIIEQPDQAVHAPRTTSRRVPRDARGHGSSHRRAARRARLLRAAAHSRARACVCVIDQSYRPSSLAPMFDAARRWLWAGCAVWGVIPGPCGVTPQAASDPCARPPAGSLLSDPAELRSRDGVLSLELSVRNHREADGSMRYCTVGDGRAIADLAHAAGRSARPQAQERARRSRRTRCGGRRAGGACAWPPSPGPPSPKHVPARAPRCRPPRPTCIFTA